MNRKKSSIMSFLEQGKRHPRSVRGPSHRSFSSHPAACSHRHPALMSRSGKMKGRRKQSVGTVEEPEENGGHEEKKEKTRRRKQGTGPGPWAGRDRAKANARERRTEVAEVELMHAPGHAPKPLTGSQPTSLYDKYKRRAQRLLLIAWQKLRNPHFVLRTPDSLTGKPPPATLSFFFSSSHPSRLSPRSWKE